MVPLPLANILHHKVRSLLSAAGVGIGVGMLITLSGLSRGSLAEVARRWSAVEADLIVYPARWTDNITTITGAGLTDADAERLVGLQVGGARAVQYVVPIFLYRLAIGGQEHNVVGVAPQDLPRVLGGGSLLPGGRAFDPDNAFARWLEARLSGGGDQPVNVTEQELAEHGGLEMIIDSRLARACGLSVGSTVYAAGQHFTVVGVVPDGALARAMIPRATAEYLFNGPLGRYTLLFVRLAPHVRPGAVLEALAGTRHLSAVPVKEYHALLEDRFGVMYAYVDTVNAVTLVVAFLFILVTLYTMVIQHQREIAILKSMGATGAFIVRQVLAESVVLTGLGAVIGVAMSFAAAWAIQALRPLLTVTITWPWVALAGGAALAGGLAAGLYPGLCAARVDVVSALTLE